MAIVVFFHMLEMALGCLTIYILAAAHWEGSILVAATGPALAPDQARHGADL